MSTLVDRYKWAVIASRGFAPAYLTRNRVAPLAVLIRKREVVWIALQVDCTELNNAFRSGGLGSSPVVDIGVYQQDFYTTIELAADPYGHLFLGFAKIIYPIVDINPNRWNKF